MDGDFESIVYGDVPVGGGPSTRGAGGLTTEDLLRLKLPLFMQVLSCLELRKAEAQVSRDCFRRGGYLGCSEHKSKGRSRL